MNHEVIKGTIKHSLLRFKAFFPPLIMSKVSYFFFASFKTKGSVGGTLHNKDWRRGGGFFFWGESEELFRPLG